MRSSSRVVVALFVSGVVGCAAQDPTPEPGGSAGAGGARDSAGGSGGAPSPKPHGNVDAAIGSGGDLGGGGGAGGDPGMTTPEGGAGGTSPTTDAASPDTAAPSDAPAAPAADGGASVQGGACAAKLCDDFEGHKLGMLPGAPFASAGALKIDATKAFSGKQSVLIKGGAGNVRAWMTLGKPILPVPSNDLHGRMMVFLTKAPEGFVHWDNVQGRGPGGTYNVAGMYAKFMANYVPHDCWKNSRKFTFPQGRWSCLQWEFNGSKDANGASKNELKMWMDGVYVDDGSVIKTGQGCIDGYKGEWNAPSSFDTLRIGWENYQRSPIPIEMWIDDVAVGDKPIACPAKP